MPLATLDIVIVNYNSGGDLQTCVESLGVAAKGSGTLSDKVPDPFVSIQRIVIVDNASSDESIARLPPTTLPLLVIRNSFNRGFASACNQGAQDSTADFILFLNPDAALLHGSLERPIRLLCGADCERVGICGVQLLDQHGKPARTCMRFPSPARFLSKLFGLTRLAPRRFPAYEMADWPHDETRKVDIVIGAFFLVRRPVYDALGGFDERYFLYFEEVDFCERAKHAGWATLYFAGAQAYHRGGPSWNRSDTTRLYHSARSRIVYSFTHFSWWSAVGITAGVLVLEPVWRLVSSLATRSWCELRAGLAAYTRLWLATPGLVSGLNHSSIRR